MAPTELAPGDVGGRMRREVAVCCDAVHSLAELAALLAESEGQFTLAAHGTPWPDVLNAYVNGCHLSSSKALEYIDICLDRIQKAVAKGATDGND